MPNVLFADVSYFQPKVDDSYPYDALSIRVSDGTFVDPAFADNYAWMRSALDSGKLTVGIVYTYVRPQTWATNARTVIDTINANGGLHPRVALMLDVESGGNLGGDQSAAINSLFNELAMFAGTPARVVGYGNIYDLKSMWPRKPAGMRLGIASYGSDPDYPGKLWHQYTDGTGYGAASGLPDGCPPFGNCDFNSADGLTAEQFAAACGITTPTIGGTTVTTPSDPAADADQQLRGPDYDGWPQLGGRSLVDAIAAIGAHLAIPGFTNTQEHRA